jgi:hypothetical protein
MKNSRFGPSQGLGELRLHSLANVRAKPYETVAISTAAIRRSRTPGVRNSVHAGLFARHTEAMGRLFGKVLRTGDLNVRLSPDSDRIADMAGSPFRAINGSWRLICRCRDA